jgi:hypothetical protein
MAIWLKQFGFARGGWRQVCRTGVLGLLGGCVSVLLTSASMRVSTERQPRALVLGMFIKLSAVS